jgi:hypothetical protein
VPTKQMRCFLRVGTVGEVRVDADRYGLTSPPLNHPLICSFQI